MAPTGVEVEAEAAVIGELEATLDPVLEVVTVGDVIGDVMSAELEGELEVEVANVLVGVEDGAAVKVLGL
jgi:hypothetical protein